MIKFIIIIAIVYYSYNLRPVTDSQLQIINGRIDEKISRRRQQQYEREQKSKQSHQQQQRQQPTKSEPIHSSPSSTSNSSCTPINSNVSRSNNEEYSIFRDPPSSALLPSTATVNFTFTFSTEKFYLLLSCFQ